MSVSGQCKGDVQKLKRLKGANGEKIVWVVSKRYMLHKQAKFDKVLVRALEN